MQATIRPERDWITILNTVHQLNLEALNETWGSGTLVAIDDCRPVKDFLVAEIDGKKVGWCIRFDRNETHVYVHPSFRRKGIGQSLLTEMASLYSACKVVPWDNRSEAFFKKNQHLNLIF